MRDRVLAAAFALFMVFWLCLSLFLSPPPQVSSEGPKLTQTGQVTSVPTQPPGGTPPPGETPPPPPGGSPPPPPPGGSPPPQPQPTPTPTSRPGACPSDRCSEVCYPGFPECPSGMATMKIYYEFYPDLGCVEVPDGKCECCPPTSTRSGAA